MSVSGADTGEDPAQLPGPPHAKEWPQTRLPLATLTPESAVAQPAFVEGQATLLWPYSQSNSTFSVLVCEDDFRLRNNKGQLKVNFRGAAARDMKDKLQIGNKVQLSLEGAELEELKDATPRDVPWALKYSHRLYGKVKTDSGETSVDIEDREPSPVPLSATIDDTFEEDDFDEVLVTPPKRRNLYSQPSENEWHTPGSNKRGLDRITSSPIIPRGFFSGGDMFGDAYPRKKARFSSSFRIVDRSPSPEIPADASQAIEALNKAITESRRGTMVADGPLMPDSSLMEGISTMDEVVVEEGPPLEDGTNGQPSFSEMFPPPLPDLDAQFSGPGDHTEMPDSPSLRPVASPSLPLVSPFIHKEMEGDDYMSMDVDGHDFDTGAHELNGHELELLGYLTEPVPQTPPAEVLQPEFADYEESREPQEPQTNEKSPKSPKPPSLEVQQEPSAPKPQESPASSKEPAQADSPNYIPSTTTSPNSSADLSERDSLFDDQSDAEPPRPRSKSPLPGPSPLRKMTTAKFPGSPNKNPSSLSIRTGFTPVNESRNPLDTPLKTPHLYLPTPSPKVSLEGTGFPFTAPPKVDITGESGDMPSMGERRRLFSESQQSRAPGSKWVLGPSKRRMSLGAIDEMTERVEGAEPLVKNSEGESQDSPVVIDEDEELEEYDDDEEVLEEYDDEEDVDQEGYASDDEKAEGERLEDEVIEVLDDDGAPESAAEERDAEDEGLRKPFGSEEREDLAKELEETLDEELQHDEEMEDEIEEAVNEVIAQADEEMAEDDEAESEFDDAVDEIIAEAEDEMADTAAESEAEEAFKQVQQEPEIQDEDDESPAPRRPLAVDEFEDEYSDEPSDEDDPALDGDLESGDEEGSCGSDESRVGSEGNSSDYESEANAGDGPQQQPVGFVPGQVIDLISDDEDQEEAEEAKPQPERPAEVEEPESSESGSDSGSDDESFHEAREEREQEEEEEEQDAEVHSQAPSTPKSDSRPPKPTFKSGITTSLSDFPSIAFCAWGQTVDLIGVVTQTTPISQAKAGQKDFYTALRIADSSKTSGMVVRIFRSHEKALPRVSRGDVIILRAFRIASQKNKDMAVSTENSAWAVWSQGREKVDGKGPPLEYGEEEEGYVKGIGEWYHELDEKTREQMEGRGEEELTAGVQ